MGNRRLTKQAQQFPRPSGDSRSKFHKFHPDFPHLSPSKTFMRDIIFVSLENWDGIWRRNQFLCAEWMRRFPEMRILFVGRPRDFSHSIRVRSLESFKGMGTRPSCEFKGLTLLNPLKLMPHSLSAGRRINTRLLLHQVKRAAHRAGLRSPLLWINDHHAAPLVGQVGERAVVYDITDDWTLMRSTPQEERQRVMASDSEMCAAADLVVVCSEALEKSRKASCRRIVRIPNGVEADHYAGCRSPQPKNFGPVFGYLGTLHGERLDFQLIEALATRRPHCRIVLCGPDMLTDHERLHLGGLSNVEIRKAVHYRDAPGVLSTFDVCILPHRRTPFTESLNPIKLWEYLASGKPIAATSVAGFRDFAHLCSLGDGSAGFVAACDAAYGMGAERGGERVQAAEANSWKSRVDDLQEIFRQEGWIGRPASEAGRHFLKAGAGAGISAGAGPLSNVLDGVTAGGCA